jgi:hypothetical protein
MGARNEPLNKPIPGIGTWPSTASRSRYVRGNTTAGHGHRCRPALEKLQATCVVIGMVLATLRLQCGCMSPEALRMDTSHEQHIPHESEKPLPGGRRIGREAGTVQPGIADDDKKARTGTIDEPVRSTPPAGDWNDVA